MAETNDTVFAYLWPMHCAMAHVAVLNAIITGQSSKRYWALLGICTDELGSSLDGAPKHIKTHCKRLYEAAKKLLSQKEVTKSKKRELLDKIHLHNVAIYDYWKSAVRHATQSSMNKNEFIEWINQISDSEKIELIARLVGQSMD